MRRIWWPMWASLALSIAAPASAQTPPDEARKDAARALANTGRARFDSGDYAGAVEALRDAEAYFRAPTIRRLRALALEKLGRLVEAREVYESVAREPLAPGAPPEFVAAQAEANEALTSLDLRIPRAQITLANAPVGTRVALDDRPLDLAALTAPIRVDPGVHVLAVEPPGAVKIIRQIRAQERSVEKIDIDLTPPPAPAAPAPPPLRPAVHARPVLEAPAGGRSIVAPAIAFGIGGAGLIAGAVTGGLSLMAASEIRGECGDPPVCAPHLRGRVEEGKTLGHVSTAGFVVAGVGAAAGVVWLLWPNKSAAPARVDVAVGPGFLGLKGAL